ncbi:hypothetical protein WKH56_08760 [Priestia sp. SB1]|uniref:Uncharacterized protein n=1 Tax=Priestia aryabhattai TaxID=412384 RepID=A0AAX6NDK0_PRIAR|nr:hypothetical protein [Priestia aryabhattai]MDU9693968.1 hypothetical protein [Priestia aryabhattai]
MKQHILDNFTNVDMRGLQMPVIAVFYNTLDIPNKYAARLLDLNRPTNVVVIKNTLEEIRNVIPAGLTRINRQPDEHPTIVETWL